MTNPPDMRPFRVPITCSHDRCDAVHLIHHAYAADTLARGWTCLDHQPRDLDPDLTHATDCRGGRSISRRQDGTVLHVCPGCGATCTRKEQGP